MGDSFSPFSAARMLIQVLPAGPIKANVFNDTVKILREAGPIQLRDINPPPDPDRNLFNPSKFPRGRISFSFTSSSKSLSHSVLYPFETFREPFLVLGLADASEFSLDGDHDVDAREATRDPGKRSFSELNSHLSQLRDNYPNGLVHRIILVVSRQDQHISDLPDGILTLRPRESINSLLCGLAAQLLPEMTGLVKSFQALQNYPSPLALNRDGQGDENGAGGSRRGSLRPFPSPSSSSQDIKASHRMSMPVMSSSAVSPLSGSRPGTPGTEGRSTPATTFDDIPGAVPPHVASRISTPPAGLWGDALRELSESATRARASGDYLWHAKSLENLAVCLLLLAWNGISFRIPDICYPSSTRPLAAMKGLQSPPSGGPGDAPAATPEEVIEAIRGLYEIIPELIHMIRDAYNRTWDIPGESLPQFAYSEINIRFARLLVGLSDDGHLDGGMRQLMPTDSKLVLPRFSRGRAFARQTSDMLQAAIPPPSDFSDISIMDTVTILGAVVSSYSALGMARKSMLVLQDFLDTLIPGLVQARKVGAAEAGMHPAAGIANLQSQAVPSQDPGQLVESILKFFESIDLLPVRSDGQEEQEEQEVDATSSTAISTNKDTKINLLRKCIKVCEALPDFNGVLRCTAAVFTLAGPGSAPNIASPDVFILIPPEEQIMLAANFYRTSDLIDNLGLPKSGGDYWDPFLVRGLEVQLPPPGREMISRRMNDFDNTAIEQIGAKAGPFLHNAFNKKTKGPTNQAVFVAGESCSFSVTLQNLFDFEIHIDSLELVTSMDDFVVRREGIRLGPHRVQMFAISGTPKTAGPVHVTECKVIPKGCMPKTFDIIPGPWSPPDLIKISDGLADAKAKDEPKLFILEGTVLEPQPLLDLTKLSLSQKAIEVLEGERKSFKVTLTNHMTSSRANFVRITPQDNIRVYLQSALKERDIRPSFRYEMEYQVYQDPNVRCIKGLDQQNIGSNEPAEFEFEILGKPGLSHASIQFDYCYLPDSTLKESFFTRMLEIPFTVAVKPSIRLLGSHLAVLPQDPMGVLAPRDRNCWMIMDFRNLSHTPLKLSLQQNSESASEEGISSVSLKDGQEELIASGRTSTVSSAIPKVFIERPHTAIPSLDPTKEQQFVLRTSGGAPIDERVERECFWFSSSLINSLSASWTDPDSGKSGTVNLRDISLAPDEVDVLRLDDVSIFWTSELKGSLGVPSTAKFKLLNRTQETIRVELQLYRTIAGFVDRIAGSHVESQLMSAIGPNTEVEEEFDCMFEIKGHHVFVPTVVEREARDGAMDRPLRTWQGEPKFVTVK
ncbi:Trs120-domain-containing protein [Rhizodiscina lignyota]|uniref:Trs120-domain-containing protein n=1 Tax=Rhizodiscina lignyota TaxID=1504668 RepID=A0A9P4M4E1_9PEZI|nr:Trs120-domain-containing protein [Rhizodiscina lignyota]